MIDHDPLLISNRLMKSTIVRKIASYCYWEIMAIMQLILKDFNRKLDPGGWHKHSFLSKDLG